MHHIIQKFERVADGNFTIYILLLALIAVLCVYCILQFTALRLLVRREWLGWLLHSRHFPKGSCSQQMADVLRAWLVDAAEAKTANVVTSPKRTYQLIAPIGAGDLCDVHMAVAEGRRFVVKLPRVAGCDSLLLKEQHILHLLQDASDGNLYGDYYPLPAETFQYERRLAAAYAWREGFESVEAMRRQYRGGLDGRHIAWMFNRTLEALGFAHRQGWIHGAVLPPHLLFQPENHGLHLIGWTHAERRGTPLRLVPHKFKAWYPPECHRRETATAATDIFLAARSMIWLAGGHPLSINRPDTLPPEIHEVLLHCLDDAPSSRPQDAWKLHAHFNQLLEDVYGPPAFCHLHVSRSRHSPSATAAR